MSCRRAMLKACVHVYKRPVYTVYTLRRSVYTSAAGAGFPLSEICVQNLAPRSSCPSGRLPNQYVCVCAIPLSCQVPPSPAAPSPALSPPRLTPHSLLPAPFALLLPLLRLPFCPSISSPPDPPYVPSPSPVSITSFQGSQSPKVLSIFSVMLSESYILHSWPFQFPPPPPAFLPFRFPASRPP